MANAFAVNLLELLITQEFLTLYQFIQINKTNMVTTMETKIAIRDIFFKLIESKSDSL